jgi:hypothetical protein
MSLREWKRSRKISSGLLESSEKPVAVSGLIVDERSTPANRN